MAEIHYSDIRGFKYGCRRKWKYTSPLKYNLRPKMTPNLLSRGLAYHVAFDEYHKNGADPSVAFALEYRRIIARDRALGAIYDLEEVEDTLQTGVAVLAMYPKWSDENDTFEIVEGGIEERLQVPFFDNHTYDFRVDQRIRKADGTMWIHDFKTVKTMPTDDFFITADEQITGYLKACELKFGETYHGAIFTYILVKKPNEPKIIKSGNVSRAKIFTTPRRYYDAIINAGLDPVDYKDMLISLKKNVWFERFEIVKTQAQKDTQWSWHKRVAQMMLDYPDEDCYPSVTRMNCTGCVFQGPCLYEQQGSNPIELLKNQYVKSKAR